MDLSKPNWGIIGIILLTALVWYSVFTNGLFLTITWLIIISCVIGLCIRLSGRG